MNFVSRACSEGGSLAGPEAMVVWGGVTWLDLTQRPSPGLDLTPRGLGPTQPTSPGCSSEVGRAVAPDHDIDVGAVARDRLAGVSAGAWLVPSSILAGVSAGAWLVPSSILSRGRRFGLADLPGPASRPLRTSCGGLDLSG